MRPSSINPSRCLDLYPAFHQLERNLRASSSTSPKGTEDSWNQSQSKSIYLWTCTHFLFDPTRIQLRHHHVDLVTYTNANHLQHKLGLSEPLPVKTTWTGRFVYSSD